MAGVRASRILPTICVHRCSVAQVSLQAACGKAGQASLRRVAVSRSIGCMAMRNSILLPGAPIPGPPRTGLRAWGGDPSPLGTWERSAGLLGDDDHLVGRSD